MGWNNMDEWTAHARRLAGITEVVNEGLKGAAKVWRNALRQQGDNLLGDVETAEKALHALGDDSARRVIVALSNLGRATKDIQTNSGKFYSAFRDGWTMFNAVVVNDWGLKKITSTQPKRRRPEKSAAQMSDDELLVDIYGKIATLQRDFKDVLDAGGAVRKLLLKTDVQNATDAEKAKVREAGEKFIKGVSGRLYPDINSIVKRVKIILKRDWDQQESYPMFSTVTEQFDEWIPPWTYDNDYE